MKKVNILARSISNLTDARYFAAMGVNFLGFDLSTSDSELVDTKFVSQIKEWVEGPKIIACVSGTEDEEQLTKIVVDNEVDGLYFERFPGQIILDVFQHLSLFVELTPETPIDFHLDDNFIFVVKLAEFGSIEIVEDFLKTNNIDRDKVMIDGDLSASFYNSTLFSQLMGLVLRGGEEEKAGFKSFDDLDEIFEILEMMD